MDLLVIERISEHAVLPKKAHHGDLGFDLCSTEAVTLHAGKIVLVSTGLRMKFPEGWGGKIFDRSSIATKKGLTVLAGVIDNGYRGEVKIALYNTTPMMAHIERGEAIAQFIPVQVVDWHIVQGKVDPLETSRGEGGFGSTNA